MQSTEQVTKGRQWIHATNGDIPVHKPTLSGFEVCYFYSNTFLTTDDPYYSLVWTPLKEFLFLVCCFLQNWKKVTQIVGV